MQIRRRSAIHRRQRGTVRLPAPLGGPQADRRENRPVPASARGPGATEIVEILSHELRSPITTIHLGTKVLRGAGTGISGPVRGEVVAAVEEEAERLYRLVEDLLAVARHEDVRVSLPTRPLLLQHWLPSVIDAEVNADPGLRVRTSLPADLPAVLVDDGALAQVLRNVLRNAARYAADGMPVEVVCRPPDDGVVVLELLDRGPGIDPAEVERLFEPFYRAEAVRVSGSAAGLGLAAARRLCRAMGGDIEGSPRDGGGARFVVRLPAARAEELPDDEVSRAGPAGW